MILSNYWDIRFYYLLFSIFPRIIFILSILLILVPQFLVLCCTVCNLFRRDCFSDFGFFLCLALKIHFGLGVRRNILSPFVYFRLLVVLVGFVDFVIKICIRLNYLYGKIKYFWIFVLFFLESLLILLVYCEYLLKIIVVIYSFLHFIFGFLYFFLINFGLLIFFLFATILFNKSNHTIKEFHLFLQDFLIKLNLNQTHFVKFFIWNLVFVLICLLFNHKNCIILSHFV